MDVWRSSANTDMPRSGFTETHLSWFQKSLETSLGEGREEKHPLVCWMHLGIILTFLATLAHSKSAYLVIYTVQRKVKRKPFQISCTVVVSQCLQDTP